MTQAELKELKDEIERLKSFSIDMILEKDLHKAQSNHKKLERLYKIYKQETGIDLKQNRRIKR